LVSADSFARNNSLVFAGFYFSPETQLSLVFYKLFDTALDDLVDQHAAEQELRRQVVHRSALLLW
jgi:hypothetical protein